MENQPPENNDKNYPEIQKPAKQNQTTPPEQPKTTDEKTSQNKPIPKKNQLQYLKRTHFLKSK